MVLLDQNPAAVKRRAEPSKREQDDWNEMGKILLPLHLSLTQCDPQLSDFISCRNLYLAFPDSFECLLTSCT